VTKKLASMGILDLLAFGLGNLIRLAGRLGWRWRAPLTPLWTAVAVAAAGSTLRLAWPTYWWIPITLGVLTAPPLYVYGPKLSQPLQRMVLAVVPSALDDGKKGVLDRDTERAYLSAVIVGIAGWLSWLGQHGWDRPTWYTFLGCSAVSAVPWIWHRRIRRSVNRYIRRHAVIEETVKGYENSHATLVSTSKAVTVVAVRLGAGKTIEHVGGRALEVASAYGLRVGGVTLSADPKSARRVLHRIVPRDPWGGVIHHPMPPIGALSMAEDDKVVLARLEDGSDLMHRLGQHTLIVGQSGCIAPETRIYLPLTGEHVRVDELAQRGQPINVLAWTSQGMTVARTSGAPFLKGRAELFEVQCSGGATLRVTSEHRFLTPRGWRRLADVRVGQLLAAAPHGSPGSSEYSQSGSHGDVRRSLRTTADCLDGCSTYPSPDGRSLLVESGSAPVALPLPPGGLGRTQPCSTQGVPVGEPGCSHACRRCNRQPTLGVGLPLETWIGAERLASSGCSAQPSGTYRSAQLLRPATDLIRRVIEFSLRLREPAAPLRSSGSMFGGLASGYLPLGTGTRSRNSSPQRLSLWKSWVRRLRNVAPLQQERSSTVSCENPPCRCAHPATPGCRESSGGHSRASSRSSGKKPRRDRAVQLHQGQQALLHSSWWDTVRSIRSVGYGDFYDLTVPGPDNYVAEGLIHHNSGKSVTLDTLMTWFTLASVKDCRVVAADMASGVSLGEWEPILAAPLATSAKDALLLLQGVMNVIIAREKVLKRAKLKKWTPTPTQPWLFVVIDEFPSLIRSGQMVDLLVVIAERARKTGVWLYLAAQNGSKADLGSTELRAQMMCTIGLRLDRHMSGLLWGDGAKQGWDSTPLREGTLLLRDEARNEPRVAKGVFTTDGQRSGLIRAVSRNGAIPLDSDTSIALLGDRGTQMVLDMDRPQLEIVREQPLNETGRQDLDVLAERVFEVLPPQSEPGRRADYLMRELEISRGQLNRALARLGPRVTQPGRGQWTRS
jgi:hypothetical protein